MHKEQLLEVGLATEDIPEAVMRPGKVEEITWLLKQIDAGQIEGLMLLHGIKSWCMVSLHYAIVLLVERIKVLLVHFLLVIHLWLCLRECSMGIHNYRVAQSSGHWHSS